MTAYPIFKRKNFNQFNYLFFQLLILINTAAAQVTLENDQIKLITDGKHIISLYDKVRKLEHVTSDYTVANGLFGVSYVDTVTMVVAGTLNSSQVTSVTINKVGNDEATFKYDSNNLTASVTVKLKANVAEAAWTISLQLKNKAYAFSQVDFPRFRTAQSYGGEFKKFVDPNWEGRIYSMNKEWTAYSRFYPAGQSLQLSACISKGGGVAIWCNDTKGLIKSFGYLNNGTASHLGVRHLMPYGNLKPGQGANWSTDYETIFTLCGNSWEDAAEIYRSWAIKQTWSKTQLKHRTDVPAAFHNSPLTISSMLTTETLSSLPSRLKAWADKFNTHIIYRPLEWEKYGSWAGIDYFPSGIGDDKFIQLNKDLNKINITTAGFIESYHWTYHIDDATAAQNAALLNYYNANKGKELSRTMANGSVYTLTSDGQTKSFLCRGTELGKTMIQNVAIGLFDRGVNLVHNDYDHLIGGGGPCFNKAHGHPIPYGWEMDVMMKVYSDIVIEGKSRKLEDFSVSKEWPCELLNMTLHCYQARNWKIISSLKETIPLFIYVYHDYIPVSYGLPSAALDFAASIVYGEMQSLRMVGVPVSVPENGTRETILTDYYESMKIYAKEFLLYGRLMKPAVLISARAVHNTWQDDQGNIAVFAIDTLETNINIVIKVPGTSVKYMNVYTGKTLISTKQVKGGDLVMLDIPKWRLCAAIFTEYPLSVKSLIEKNPIKLHPNPVTTILNIETTIDIQNMEVDIFDSTGKSMGKFNKNTIDFQNFDSGVYIISIKSNNHLSYHKVIKQSIN